MGFRYRKSIKIGGARLNLSKSGIGYSVGTKGFRVTKKAGGGTRTTTSIPGTGISFVKDSGKMKRPETESHSSIDISGASFSGSEQSTPVDPKVADVREAMLAWFLGVFGAHKFYRKKYFLGILYLLTFGLFSVGAFADGIWLTYAFCAKCDGKPIKKQIKITAWAVGISIPSILLGWWIIAIPAVIIAIASAVSARMQKVNTIQSISDEIPSKEESENEDVLKDGADVELDQVNVDATGITTESASEEIPSESVKSNKINYVERTYHVAGTSFRESCIELLGSKNADYDMTKKELTDFGMTDERIWEYEFDPSNVELIPEPENPHDPNAVKVIVDGEHVGYIKKGSCKHILKLIAEDRILRIDCEIGGGNYKIVSEEYDDEKDKEVYTLERDKTNFFVTLTIREKE